MEEKSSVELHVERELALLPEDSEFLAYAEPIKEMARIASKQGYSGEAAAFVVPLLGQAITHLLMHRTIAPLTGKDDEWCKVDTGDSPEDEAYQNCRNGAVFKLNNGRCTYLDGVVFNGDIGGKFTGCVEHNGERIFSRQEIKSFPFEPKTFYVDVKDFRWTKDESGLTPCEDGDWWTHELTNPEQLEAVFAYYERPRKEAPTE